MGEKINVLFLDHDGVICLPDQWGRRSEGSLEIDKYFDKFDKKSIKILNEIIEKTNCEIVISSDWRFHCKIDLMQELYLKRGILKLPFDYTTIDGLEIPDNFNWQSKFESEQTRSLEIIQYLNSNPRIKNWVAVDDMDLRKFLSNKKSEIIEVRDWGLENFVWTSKYNEGIKQCSIKNKIIDFLTRN
jgi:hypothetical protein